MPRLIHALGIYPELNQSASLENICKEAPTLYVCNQYPVRKLILDESGLVKEIRLYKSPTNGEPPV